MNHPALRNKLNVSICDIVLKKLSKNVSILHSIESESAIFKVNLIELAWLVSATQARLQAIAGGDKMDHDMAWLGGDSSSHAVQQAAAAASQLNQKLGMSSAGGPPPVGNLGHHAVVNEEFHVPDSMVGLSEYLNMI